MIQNKRSSHLQYWDVNIEMWQKLPVNNFE